MYNGPSTDSPLSVCALCFTILVYFFGISLWQFIYLNVALFYGALYSCCTFFILHHFHIALFCVVIFSCWTFFRVTLFLYIVLFHVVLLLVAIFLFCIPLCCTLRMEQYHSINLQRCSQELISIYDGELCKNNKQNC